jgi:hypothetical protein
MRLRVRMTGQNASHFDKDWARISEIEEYRLDWSGPGLRPRALRR